MKKRVHAEAQALQRWKANVLHHRPPKSLTYALAVLSITVIPTLGTPVMARQLNTACGVWWQSLPHYQRRMQEQTKSHQPSDKKDCKGRFHIGAAFSYI